MDLNGKRILVTGAAGGLGLRAATYLVSMGARIAVTDLNIENLDPGLAAAAEVIVAGNLTNEQDCEAIVAACESAWGGIEGLFHCAGVAQHLEAAIDVKIQDWQHVVDVNLRAPFLIARTVGRVMLQQGYGSVVLISSAAGLNPLPLRSAYSPAKAAVGMLAQVLASEWGPGGVRVNVVAPGYIGTPAMIGLPTRGGPSFDAMFDRTPLGRLGQADEIAAAGGFLLSDAASYITGVTLPVDGGWTAFGGAGAVTDTVRH